MSEGVSFFQNRTYRLGLIVAGALLGRVQTDLFYGLIYKNYKLIQPPIIYLGVALVAIFCGELIYQINYRIHQKHPWYKNPTRRFLIQFGVDLFVVLLVVSTLSTVYQLFVGKGFVVLRDELILHAVLFTVIFIYNFALLQTYFVKNWREAEGKVERFQKESLAFQFGMLKNQLSPHFLFNSLNTLASLIYKDQKLASDFVKEMSSVYRYILENKTSDLIALGKELDFLRAFIHMVSVRFADNLYFHITISEEAQQKKIIPLALQLLIENAIKHNVISRKKPLTVSIFDQGEFLIVENNIQAKSVKEYSSGIGLENISSRYAFLTENPVFFGELDDKFVVKIPLLK
ncbi:MAG: sensor histidine kinase [Luteibaculaceae bacterium]